MEAAQSTPRRWMWSMQVVIMHVAMRSGAGQGAHEAYEGSAP